MHALVRVAAVTARVTTLKGPDAGAYYVEGPGRYYLDGDEPPGRWLGRGATTLGLDGEVGDDDFLSLMDGRDPATDGLLGTSHHERTVRGFDVTCSAPKSVSVLFAIGDDRVRKEVLDAHDAAVAAAFGWIEDHAHCRYRVDGEVWTVDARGLVAAALRQHTSRAHDPQIHTHLVIPNRVIAPDGRWLALDARTLKHDQRTISALYAAGLRAELTSRLGVRWNEVVNGQAEMADAPEEVLDAFSQRTRQMARRLDEKTERFVDNLGRRPTPRERWRIEREAAIDSRPSKTSEDAQSLREQWAEQLDALGYNPTSYVDGVAGRTRPIEADATTDRDAVVDALSSLRDTQSVWRPAEITREIAAALPTRLGGTATETVDRAQRLASHVEDALTVDISRPVPDNVPLRQDGRPVTEGALDRILTTRAILDEEEHILGLTRRWTAEGGSDAQNLDPYGELTAVQNHAAGAVAGERRLVMVVGPAGTGKTTAMAPAVARLHAEGRPCFGVAPSAAAAEVLAVDTGIEADTLDKLLVEHRLDRPPRHRYDLPADDTTVIVDEAAMVPTPRLAELIDLADRRGWRLALVGDPMQFAAVGRSGMFGHLVETIGAVELDRVHRFDAFWERDASLRLRRGDTDVVALYDRNARLHGGTARQMATATVIAWRQAIEAGETAAMMAPTREAVAVLNEIAQQLRIAAGKIDPKSPSVRLGPTRAHVGDLVATRRNDRSLITDRGRMVKNRDHWSIEAVHPGGALTVAGPTGHVTLPADYVAADVELAYAETSHATQGRTVDRSFLYLDGPTDTRGIYVPLTRGRTTNEAFVVLSDERTAAEVIAECVARTWIDQPATALLLDHAPEPSDTGKRRGRGVVAAPAARPRLPLPAGELRVLIQRAIRQQSAADKHQAVLDDHNQTISNLARWARETERECRSAEKQLAEAKRTLAEHDRPLHRRHHRTEIRQAKHDVAELRGKLHELNQDLTDLVSRHAAEKKAQRRTITAATARPEDRAIDQTEAVLSNDARNRGENIAADPDPRYLEHLGPVPDSAEAREHWVEAAGRAAQHHSLWGQPTGERFVGHMPTFDNDEDYRHTFYAANQAIHDLDRTAGIPHRAQDSPGLAL